MPKDCCWESERKWALSPARIDAVIRMRGAWLGSAAPLMPCGSGVFVPGCCAGKALDAPEWNRSPSLLERAVE